MGEDVNGGHAHQNEEEEEDARQPATTGAQGKEKENGSDADMTAGEGSSGSFSRVVRHVEQMIEETIRPAWCRHAEIVRQEPVAQIGKYACSNLVETHGRIVELRSSDRYKNEDDIIGKEGSKNDCRCPYELMVASYEIIEYDKDDEWEIADVAKTHQFGKPPLAGGF